jgi:threonylcarbamoyladenosine tRNA methylthiotransferase MtaB
MIQADQKRFMVKTLGCKANSSDGQRIEAGLIDRGFLPVGDESEAQVVIVNSCTVTDEADRQSRKLVRDLARKNPGVRVIYTGCGAEVDPEGALRIPGVSGVIGNQDKHRAAEWIEKHLSGGNTEPEILGSVRGYGELRSRHPMDREWSAPLSGAEEILKLDENASTYRTRAFIKVQEGCDSFCTYCVIPYGRGPARSIPVEEVVSKIQLLVREGIREVILTGTNIGEYGQDQAGAPTIEDLLEGILLGSGVERLRIGSLDPVEISERMLRLLEEYPAFCPHFHVSLQHVDSKILKLMKRKYDSDAVERCLRLLAEHPRKPFVGMDYITGFPGETEADFEQAFERLSSLPWNRLHVFPYSERSGTPATRLPGRVPQEARKSRARTLQELSLKRMARFFAGEREMNGGVVRGVLLEGTVRGPDGTRDWVSGYSPNYQRVVVPAGDRYKRNEVTDLRVGRWFVDRASGEVSWIGERHV